MGFELVEEEYKNGKGSWQEMADWSKRWLQAELERSNGTAEQVLARVKHLDRLKER